VFSLEEGSIISDPERVAPEPLPAGVDVSNFSVAASFSNPVSFTFRHFSYGVKFRQTETEYQAIAINSAGQVRHVIGTPGIGAAVDTTEILFDYDDVAKTAGTGNSINLTVIEDRAWLYINDEYLGEFSIGGVGVSSDVELIAELENETNVIGATTRVAAVEVRDAQIESFIDSGTFVKEAGEITRTEPTGILRDSLVQADFVVPYELILGRWTVGFEYFEPVTETTNWLIVNNRRQWRHLRQVGSSGEIVELAIGTSTEILRDRGDVNNLSIFGQNGTYMVLINDVVVTELVFDPEDQPARVSWISGFEATDQQPTYPTQYSNYTVWSLGK
jgi:hypothetical protein